MLMALNIAAWPRSQQMVKKMTQMLSGHGEKKGHPFFFVEFEGEALPKNRGKQGTTRQQR